MPDHRWAGTRALADYRLDARRESSLWSRRLYRLLTQQSSTLTDAQSLNNSSINVDSEARTWDNRGLIIYAVCDQAWPRPETDTNARTGGRAPLLHD